MELVDIENEIRDVIANITGRELSEISRDANFWNDLGIDSIKAIEIAVSLERKFGVAIPDEKIPKISTVKEAALVVKEVLDAKSQE